MTASYCRYTKTSLHSHCHAWPLATSLKLIDYRCFLPSPHIVWLQKLVPITLSTIMDQWPRSSSVGRQHSFVAPSVLRRDKACLGSDKHGATSPCKRMKNHSLSHTPVLRNKLASEPKAQIYGDAAIEHAILLSYQRTGQACNTCILTVHMHTTCIKLPTHPCKSVEPQHSSENYKKSCC